MDTCAKPGDFKKYFDENMQALGLTVPANLFETYERSVATAVVLTNTFNALGSGATIAELAGATFALEKLSVVGSMGAVGYVGAVIGSIAVAVGRVQGCGARISDVFVLLHQNDLTFKGWDSFFTHNPQVLDTRHPFRRSFALLAATPVA